MREAIFISLGLAGQRSWAHRSVFLGGGGLHLRRMGPIHEAVGREGGTGGGGSPKRASGLSTRPTHSDPGGPPAR